jgi:hypothetical protein
MNSMMSLQAFEDRLHREMPRFHWRCEPGCQRDLIPGTEIPKQIVVTLEDQLRQVVAPPRQLNGQLLLRWGIDATARLLSEEFTSADGPATARLEWAWDKLSEY